jgi:hypothetical protein
MRARANKKALVVPIDEARRRLREPKPLPSRTRRARPRWVMLVAASSAIALVIGVAARLALAYGGTSRYLVPQLMVLGVIGASIMPLGLLWLANRRDRRRGQSGEPRVISWRNNAASHHPPSRPSRPCA